MDKKPGSGKVHRKGATSERKRDHKHYKRPCRSAPEDPANVSLHFRKRNEGHRSTWRGIVRFDTVSTDVAGRDLTPEHYEAELRAVDASGDPVETHGQEVSAHADGSDFSVQVGSAPVVGKARRLDAVNARIAHNLTGLTTGIEVGVDCYARKDTGAANSRIHFAVWDTVLGTEVAQKNGDPDTIKPKLLSTLSFTPVAAHGYELRATFLSGNTGNPVIQAIQWHDKGDAAIWRHRVPGDADPKRAAFPDLAKPKVWYYQARCRAMNRVQGARCWSAWSPWTAATNPVTGDPIGPPAPDGITLTFHRDEARKKSPFQAKVLWNELPWWVPPDGEPVDGADRYAVRLAISEDGGSTTIRTRRTAVQAKDEDADQTAYYEFNNIRRRRRYRASVRAFKDDRRGAWSAWSAWKAPATDIGNGPNNPLNVDTVKVKPGHFRTTWDEPTNSEDVDYYRVRVFVLGALKETRRTRSTHFRYVVPDVDRGKAHRFRVTAVDEDENLSAEIDTAEQNDDPDSAVTDSFEVGDVRKLTHVSIANWLTNHGKWLRANGQALATGTYAALFAEIGYTYGGGGGTFNLPDLNGRHSIGVSSLLAIGANDGDAEAARLVVHAHSTDVTGRQSGVDTTYGEVGTGDQANTPGADYTQEVQTHAHNTGFNTDAASAGTAQGGSGAPNDVTRIGHTHHVTGYVQARDNSHDHQGHGHGNHGHNHAHNNGNHHHSHNHPNHQHDHGHDQKKRPHLAVHYVIKVLP